MAEQVTAFESKRGKLYRTQQEAGVDDAQAGVHELVRELGIGSGGSWDGDMIADELIQNADKFIYLLGKIAMYQDRDK